MIEAAVLLLLPLIPLAVLYFANELYYRAVGFYRRKWTLLTAMVGTPVHEISHAAVAILFGMRVKKMRLYEPDPESNTLGYVNYAYNPFSFTHRLGMFFVGLAPAIIGAYLVGVILALLDLPLLTNRLAGFRFSDLAGLSLYQTIWGWYGDLLGAINGWSTFFGLMMAVFIGTHASPSKADMRGVLSGALAVGAVFWLILSLPQLVPQIPSISVLSPEPLIQRWGMAMIQMSALAVVAAFFLSIVFGLLAILRALVHGLRFRPGH